MTIRIVVVLILMFCSTLLCAGGEEREDHTKGARDAVKQFEEKRREAYDAVTKAIIEEEMKLKADNGKTIRDLLLNLGEIGDKRAIPFLAERLLNQPIQTFGDRLLAFRDRFPAAAALSSFGALGLESAIKTALSKTGDEAAICFAYYLSLVLLGDKGKSKLNLLIEKENSEKRIAQLRLTLLFVDKIPGE